MTIKKLPTNKLVNLENEMFSIITLFFHNEELKSGNTFALEDYAEVIRELTIREGK